MLTGRDDHRDVVLANDVVGHAYIVEVVDLDHDMVEPAIGARNSESHRVIAIVAMHEDEADAPFAAADLVFDAAAHSELSIEALGGRHVALADDAMSQAAAAGLEAPMHPAPGIERLVELGQRAVKNLDWIAVRIGELEDLEHSTLVGFVLGTDSELYSRFGELTLHLREFVGACHAKSKVCEVVAAVGMQHDTMMEIVHPQVASIGLAFVSDLKANNIGCEVLPFREVLHADAHVTQLSYLDHISSSMRCRFSYPN